VSQNFLFPQRDQPFLVYVVLDAVAI